MKRREVLWSFLGVVGASSATATQRGRLSASAVEELMRTRGLEPMPGEAAQARGLLLSFAAQTRTDPRVEPAIRLDPVERSS